MGPTGTVIPTSGSPTSRPLGGAGKRGEAAVIAGLGVAVEGVVHPFADLVRQSLDIGKGEEGLCGVVVDLGVGLDETVAVREGAVVSRDVKEAGRRPRSR